MKCFEHIKEFPLLSNCCESYSGMAFDGCNYYLTLACHDEVVKYDLALCKCEHISTCREYRCICYDNCDNCFWATSKSCHNRLFKLNHCLQEIGCIILKPCFEYGGTITGISFDCLHDSLLITTSNSVVQVPKCGDAPVILQKKPSTEFILGVFALSPEYLVWVLKDSKLYAYRYAFDNHKICKNEYEIPDDYLVNSIAFHPCADNCCCSDLNFSVFAIKKGGYPYICNVNLNAHCLGFTPCACNYNCCDNRCCCQHDEPCNEEPCCQHDEPCHEEHSCCDHSCNSNSFGLCGLESIALVGAALSCLFNTDGGNCACSSKPPCQTGCDTACSDIITPIALVGAALSHILSTKLSSTNECSCEHCKKKNCERCEPHNPCPDDAAC